MKENKSDVKARAKIIAELQSYEPKKIPLYFFKHEKWHFEETSIIWSSQITENITAITNNWLMLMEDEKIIDTDIQLLSAIITENKELFLSFNKDLFDKQIFFSIKS